jgi:ParB-like chromosome segregation protein Spo0J
MAVMTASNGAVGLSAHESVSSEEFDLKNLMEKLPERHVPINALVPGFYLRQSGTNAVHVQLLVGVADSADLPPILVQERGWRVIDGMHRLEAAKLRGDTSINASFLDCTDEAALVLAIRSNTLHGLPLSKADRICGAKRVLAAHPDWSDRTIAGIAGLSAKTIASLRNRSTDGAQFSSKRLGRDGKRRPLSAGEGRRRAAEYIHAHPDAPLRQVAREAEVSLGTVHDVSARIRRGTDPERNRRRSSAGRIAEAQVTRASLGLPASVNGSLSPLASVNGFQDLPASVNGVTLLRSRHNNAQPAWSGISAKLANDPAIRYTEGGKEFLRWMALRAAHVDEWGEFIDAIPVHWLGAITSVAESVSEEWTQFAERLRGKQEAAS